MAHKHAEAGDVVELASFGEDRTTAIVKTALFEVIRLVVQPGKPFPPHKVDGPITVQCLSGECTFFIEDQPQNLTTGSWLHLQGGAMHSLEATDTATLLVTILFGKD